MNIQNLKKKKKINHNFHYEIRNPRTTQERGKIELGNGEETKSDDEIQRETSDKRERELTDLWRLRLEVRSGEERESVKKK